MITPRVGSFLLALLPTLVVAADLPYGHPGFVPTRERPIGWRGDYGGIYPGATPVTTWDTASGANVRWKARMPGISNAQPIIVGDKVITTAEPHHLICCDLKTGAVVWQVVVNPMEFIAGTTPALQAAYLQALPIFVRIEEIRYKHKVAFGRRPGENELDLIKQGWRLIVPEFAKLDALGLEGMPTGLPLPTEAEINALTLDAAHESQPICRAYFGRTEWFPKKYGFRTLDVWPYEGGFALATPVSDGTNVYVNFGQGQLAAYTVATGAKVWGRYTGMLRTLNSSNMRFTAPMMYRGRLYVHFGDHLHCINPADGNTIWKTPYHMSNNCMGGPHVLRPDGATDLLVCPFGPVIRAADGKVLGDVGKGRQSEWGGIYMVGDGKDTIYHYFGGNDPNDIVAYRLSLKGDAVEKQELWRNRQINGNVTPILHDGLLYENEYGRELVVRDIATGTIVKKVGAHSNFPSFVLAGTHLFMGRGDGLTAVAVGREPKVVHNHKFVEDCDASVVSRARHAPCFEGIAGTVSKGCKKVQCEAAPTFSGDAVVARTHNFLYCFSATK